MDHVILWLHNFTLVLTVAHCKWWHPGWDEQKTCFQVEVAPFAIRQLFHMHWWWNWSSINWVEDEQGRSLLYQCFFGGLGDWVVYYAEKKYPPPMTPFIKVKGSLEVHPSQPLEEENKFEIWGASGVKLSRIWFFVSIYSMCSCWFQVECFMLFITGSGGNRQAQQATATTSNNNSSDSNNREWGLRFC